MEVEITDKQAFQELREKLINLNRNSNTLRQKIQSTDTDKQRCLITLKEIETLPPQTKTYKAIGKMFLLSPKDSLRSDLKKQVDKDESDVKGLINQRKYIDAQIAEAEKSLKELVIMKK
eukprot:gene6064-7554_t